MALVLVLLLQAQVEPTAPSDSYSFSMRATHYGVSYHGQTMGCGGTYDTNDPTIAAVGPGFYGQWPCGTQLQVEGPQGTILVTRRDSCPGCTGPYSNMIDLSEAGHRIVCGVGTCQVTVTEIK